MAVKVNNLRDWTKLNLGEVLPLENKHQRRVTIEVNTSAPVLWYGGTVFIGRTEGLSKLVLDLDGPEDIWCTGVDDADVQEVWWWTRDGAVTAVRYDESESFINVLSRAERSPEEERAMVTMFANARRNDEKLAAARAAAEARIAEIEAELEAERKKNAISVLAAKKAQEIIDASKKAGADET